MISIVICSVSGAKFAAISAHYAKLLGDEPHEIIGIHDAKSMCDGYNRGFAKSTGDILIFSHDDVEILSDDFRERLKQHMTDWDVIGIAGTDRLVGAAWWMAGPPYIFGQVAQQDKEGILVSIFGTPRPVIGGMQSLDGVFLAFRRNALQRLGPWDEQTYTGWHLYDIDMVFRAHQAGLRVAVTNDIPLLHTSGGDYGKSWQQYAHLFMQKNAAQLFAMEQRWHRFGLVRVKSRQEALEVMRPPYWKQ